MRVDDPDTKLRSEQIELPGLLPIPEKVSIAVGIVAIVVWLAFEAFGGR